MLVELSAAVRRLIPEMGGSSEAVALRCPVVPVANGFGVIISEKLDEFTRGVIAFIDANTR